MTVYHNLKKYGRQNGNFSTSSWCCASPLRLLRREPNGPSRSEGTSTYKNTQTLTDKQIDVHNQLFTGKSYIPSKHETNICRPRNFRGEVVSIHLKQPKQNTGWTFVSSTDSLFHRSEDFPSSSRMFFLEHTEGKAAKPKLSHPSDGKN